MNTIRNFEGVDIIFPPGENVATIEGDNIVECGYVFFKNSFSKPLPTLVEATYDETSNIINVKALIFIESKMTLQSALVNQLFSISNFGQKKLQLILHSNY